MNRYRIGPSTKRIELRAMEVADADVFLQLRNDPEVVRFTHDQPLASIDEARDAIANYSDFDVVGYGRWACVLKAEQRVIGFCGLKYLADLDLVDVGYRFLPSFWNQGLATEACRACVKFGHQVVGLAKIHGLVLPENTASIRVLEKSGLRYVHEFRYDGEDVELYRSERF